ncbi:hypothetical protein B0H15DRAFT_271130 [Mycena belliarum]|uniref:Ubiquitin-like domain-containing protein n=1 Tax=Mycena belliarum TaxID=1033014 RepID=A0AAD6XRF7_9AGAR|nr:hypothetical protein B0H15DRAFT_271130 [Mycena belliae]
MAALLSFGDILALANLAWTIAKILRESTGSSTEYQDLVAELESLGTALQSLDQIVSGPAPIKLQYSVENAVKFSLSKCQILMAGFLKKVEGYQHCLKKGGSGNAVRDSWRKIGWGLFKKDEIKMLKMQLMDQKTTINMLLALSHCTALERVETAARHQQITLTAMQCSMQQLPRALGHTWEGGNAHQVVWFIDAVGNKLPIPIELCITRATFDALLRVYFKDRAGSRYIEQEHYELAEERGGEVVGIRHWEGHIKPGITITTRMIYVQWESDAAPEGEVCPSCRRTIISAQDAAGFTCSFCGTSVRNYAHLQDTFPVRTALTYQNDPGPGAIENPAPDEPFIRRFLVRKAGARSAYAPGQRVSYWDSLGNVLYAVVKRFGLMVQEGTTVYNVRRESDGAQICLPSTILRPV